MGWPTALDLKATSYLQTSILKNQIAHSYLSIGSEGSGTFSISKVFGQAILCSQKDSPCMRCRTCTNIENNTHPDFLVIQPGATGIISIDIIRRLIGDVSSEKIKELEKREEGIPPRFFAMTSPLESQKKIIVIHGIEKMISDTRDILLKILEEPPQGVIFLLTTTDESLINSTLASRCQLIHIKPVAFKTIESNLIEQGFDPIRSKYIARISGGQFETALAFIKTPSLVDQMSQDYLFMPEIIMSPFAKRIKIAEEKSNLYRENKNTFLHSMHYWSLFWRDALLNSKTLNLQHPLYVTEDVMSIEHIRSLAISVTEATTSLIEIEKTIVSLSQNANTRILLESLYLSFPYRNQQT